MEHSPHPHFVEASRDMPSHASIAIPHDNHMSPHRPPSEAQAELPNASRDDTGVPIRVSQSTSIPGPAVDFVSDSESDGGSLIGAVRHSAGTSSPTASQDSSTLKASSVKLGKPGGLPPLSMYAPRSSRPPRLHIDIGIIEGAYRSTFDDDIDSTLRPPPPPEAMLALIEEFLRYYGLSDQPEIPSAHGGSPATSKGPAPKPQDNNHETTTQFEAAEHEEETFRSESSESTADSEAEDVTAEMPSGETFSGIAF